VRVLGAPRRWQRAYRSVSATAYNSAPLPLTAARLVSLITRWILVRRVSWFGLALSRLAPARVYQRHAVTGAQRNAYICRFCIARQRVLLRLRVTLRCRRLSSAALLNGLVARVARHYPLPASSLAEQMPSAPASQRMPRTRV
jgi:hypothetical protein